MKKKYTGEYIPDDNYHYFPTGNNYMVYKYLEKIFENFRQENVQYKWIEKQKVYITYNHVLSPEVFVSPDLKLSIEDYQWLSDIGQLTMTQWP